MQRRSFLKGTGALAASACLRQPAFGSVAATAKPNILMVISDQLNAFTLGVSGCNVNTPNIDKLAAEGCRFENAYTTFPLCVPWRSSMAAGMHPHQFGQRGNNGGGRDPDDWARFADATDGTTLFSLVRDAGYDCRFTGKWHMTMDPENPDFNGVIYEKARNASRARVTEKGVELIRNHTGDKPFFFTVSYDTPHEICGWRRDHDDDGSDLTRDIATEQLPPLPANYPKAPDIPGILDENRLEETVGWTEDDWRRHIWAYRHYTERMDEYLGSLVQALSDNGYYDNTLVVFVADHGDGNSSHQWGGKVALWEESVRVPLIMWRPGMVKSGHVIQSLCSTGLDLMPTLCSFAGGVMPDGYAGTDHRDNCLGADEPLHEYVVSETNMRGSRKGVAVRSQRYKYIVYESDSHPEQLFDLSQDPGETNNLIGESGTSGVLSDHRDMLRQWCESTAHSSLEEYMGATHVSVKRTRPARSARASGETKGYLVNGRRLSPGAGSEGLFDSSRERASNVIKRR